MNDKTMFDTDWVELQQRYWDGLTDMGRKAMGMEGKGDATAPWQAAMDNWWKVMSPGAGDAQSKFMTQMIDQGQKFFGMTEQFTKGLGDAKAGDDAWSAMNKTLDDMQKAFSFGLDGETDALHKMFAFWELPYDNWQRMISSLSPVPGDFLRNMPHDTAHVDKMLSAPGLGYTREEQGQYQELARANLIYQKALREYLQFYNQLGTKSVSRMREYLQGVTEKGETIDSARTLYDNWIDCCEQVYAEEVITPEYARINGNLINAQMDLKRRMSVMVDEYLGAMNMPTRSELRTLQIRMQETRRENKAMRSELNALKKQVAALLGDEAPRAAPSLPATAAAAAPRKKVVARKKAVTKKATPKPAS